MNRLIRPLPLLVLLALSLVIAGVNAARTGILAKDLASTGSTLLPKGVKAAGFPEVMAALSNKSAILLDVRPEKTYKEGHLPGALSLPYDILPQRLEALKLNANDHYILYCDGGDCHSSRNAARVLSGFGFSHLAVYEGGWEEYASRTANPGAKR